jgi:hypothetical protein
LALLLLAVEFGDGAEVTALVGLLLDSPLINANNADGNSKRCVRFVCHA